MSRSDLLAIGLAAGGVAVTFLVSPVWGWFFAFISLVTFAGYFGLWRVRKPIVEDWPVHNALNLRITNNHVKDGLADSQLTLHSVKKWEPGRRQLCDATLAKVLPVALYSDQFGLPFKTPRMFQLLEFENKSAPIIRGAVDGHAVEIPLSGHGIWQFNMELRWAGGSMLIVRFFRWDEQSLPMFCKPPS
jgi:hypothetical protein